MNLNRSKLADVAGILSGYKRHKITLINDHKAYDKDIEMFIIQILLHDINYTYISDGIVLYLDTKED